MMETVGARLKKIRLEKGIALEEVHKKTKIHLDILKSIEDDSFAGMNPVYIKGFLKIYCKFLGLNPEDFIIGYRPQKAGPRAFTAGDHRRPVLEPLSVNRYFLSPKIVSAIASLIGALLLVIALIGLFKFAKNKVRSFPKEISRYQLKESPKKVKKEKAAASLKPKAAQAAKAAIPMQGYNLPIATDNQSDLRVSVYALEDCWIQARIDGKTIFQNILKAGREETWKAKEKAELVLGSAGGVRLEVNSQVIPPLGRRGMVLKNVVITREGLRVGK